MGQSLVVVRKSRLTTAGPARVMAFGLFVVRHDRAVLLVEKVSAENHHSVHSQANEAGRTESVSVTISTTSMPKRLPLPDQA